MSRTVAKFIYCITIVVTILGTCVFLGYYFRPIVADNCVVAVDAFHKLPNNSVELMVFGSSHAWKGIDTSYMTENGINAYNYGCNWQHFNTTQLFIHDAFLTQRPKTVIIDTWFIAEMLKDTDIVGEVYYTRPLKLTPQKKKYLLDCFGNDHEKYAGYYLPFIAFHGAWDDDFRKFRVETELFTVSEFLEKRGYYGTDKVESIDPMNYADYWKESALPDESIEILDDILNLCRENDTRVILVTIPAYSGEYFYAEPLKEYAEENGCDYIDFIELIEQVGIDGETDFRDGDHLNNSGARKIADYLMEYMNHR